MQFTYAASMQEDFPELATGLLRVQGLTADADPAAEITRLHAVATARLGTGTEADLPEVQAWRRAFARMGLKPTQYRCASEALLRRFRKEGSLPRLHPLVDLCNAASLAFAVPVAVFDLDQVAGDLEVRRATGHEAHQTFGGEVERPDAGEVIFADATGRAHARRWTNRQCGHSAVRHGTTRALVVAEALHPTAAEDVSHLMSELRRAVVALWPAATVAELQVA